MSELRDLLALWDSTAKDHDEIILATVVRVEGSSYRKPGARMLMSKNGRRSGMISGGCLEGEVCRKAWWLTEKGPVVQRYGTFFDEDDPTPQSLGCGGTVDLLLEPAGSANSALETIGASVQNRTAYALLTVIKSNHPEIAAGARSRIREGDVRLENINRTWSLHVESILLEIAIKALAQKKSDYLIVRIDQAEVEFFVEIISPPLGLLIFGAGDDSQPLADFSCKMGWYTTVVDARPYLATPARFQNADRILRLDKDQDGGLNFQDFVPKPADAAVVMTHSYIQDRDLLRRLLPLRLAYLGILGPRKRTTQLVKEVAPEIGMSFEACMEKLHSPVGLNLRATTPTGIALSIVAEVQAVTANQYPEAMPVNRFSHPSTLEFVSRVYA
jgi:xanthine dehydrogenase accessory factor